MRPSQLTFRRKPLGHRILVAVVLIGALAAIYVGGRQFLSLEALIEQESALRSWLENAPVRSWWVCFVTYVVVSFVPGTTGKSLVVGWLFGFWPAVLMVNLALTVAATGSLLIGRYLLQDWVLSRFGGFVVRANVALARDGGLYVLLLRLLHAPYTVVNYSLGATTVRPRSFWWSTQLGLLPGNLVFVYAGAQLPSLHSLAAQGYRSLLTPELLFAFVALTVVPLAVRWVAIKGWARVQRESVAAKSVGPTETVHPRG